MQGDVLDHDEFEVVRNLGNKYQSLYSMSVEAIFYYSKNHMSCMAMTLDHVSKHLNVKKRVM